MRIILNALFLFVVAQFYVSFY